MQNFTRHELVTRSMEQSEVEVSNSVPLFCYCQQPNNENNEMIGCDNATCQYKWIHLVPVWQRPPKGKWYCKFCKKNTKNNKKH